MKKQLQFLTIMFLCLGQYSALSGQQDTLQTTFFPQDTLHSRPVSIKLNGENEVKEFKMPLRDSLETVNIIASAIIGSGSVDLEIYDPAGRKQGNFSLACEAENIKMKSKGNLSLRDIDESDQKAFANLYKTVNNPLRGAWIAKVTNRGAVGSLNIQFTQRTTSINGSSFHININ